MKLSPHFTLRELTRTSVRDLDNTPLPEDLANLTTVALFYLEPIRARFGPLWITSGFRSRKVNERINGSKTSAHMSGRAADFVPLAEGVEIAAVVRWVVSSGLAFDQVIEEHAGGDSWVHLGIAADGAKPRGEALLYRDGVYSAWR
jgi:putative chitinase